MNEPRPIFNHLAQVVRWPTRPTLKTAVVEYMAAKLQTGQRYSEALVNSTLKIWHTFED